MKKNNKTPKLRFSGYTDDWEQRKLGEIITEYKETVDSECTLPILTSSKTEGVILQEDILEESNNMILRGTIYYQEITVLIETEVTE